MHVSCARHKAACSASDAVFRHAFFCPLTNRAGRGYTFKKIEHPINTHSEDEMMKPKSKDKNKTAKALTDKQRALLTFLQTFIADHHYPPTFEEMRTGLRWSTKSLVDYHLTALETLGYIRREFDQSRAIEILKTE
jgi:hypothetical protein